MTPAPLDCRLTYISLGKSSNRALSRIEAYKDCPSDILFTELGIVIARGGSPHIKE